MLCHEIVNNHFTARLLASLSLKEYVKIS